VRSAIRQAQIKSVITARPIDERFPGLLPDSVNKIFIEDLARDIGFYDRIFASFMAVFAPISFIEKICGKDHEISLDDPLTIIFSSGSTGDPKGVVLSHFNLLCNVRQTDQYLKLGYKDMVLEILPMFHSFGYLGMWMAVAVGLPAIFHPNPLDAQAIGEICEKCRITFFFATPTFAQLYLRKCRPEQFGSIRNLITGAEKLSLKVVEAYHKNFGITPVEGYGTTECSPVLCINVNNYRDSGLWQIGSLQGSVGQPVPGIAVKVVDPETFKPLGFDKPGLLLVKGPNVMQGYLNLPEATAEAIEDGWYNTGDIVVLNQEGFITITDRLARLSTIGGEMVPHGVIEDLLQNLSQEEARVFAVTGVPDEKKGEILVVLYTIEPEKIPAILKVAAESGLPNLFLPKPEHFVKVDEMPVLGSGKIDLRRLKQIALDLFGPQRKFR
jgi:acyl-[acyl-carrier-protein]-phospholipid O-acyltransferase/long-chain-fatty-acid--[acyl-carrier-protein] ligase